MSSLSSQTLADQQEAILGAVAAVAENSLFAFADASEPQAFAASLEASPGDDWLQAVVGFRGSVTGRFAVAVPAGLAARLCAAFAGDDPEAVAADDLADFTGELANMMCGTWLTRTCAVEAFDLAPPAVARQAMPPEAPQAPDGSLYLAIDDTPIRVDVGWQPVLEAARP